MNKKAQFVTLSFLVLVSRAVLLLLTEHRRFSSELEQESVKEQKHCSNK